MSPAFWAPSLLIIVGAYFAVRLSNKKAMAGFKEINTFKAQKAETTPNDPGVTFADVAGLDEVVAELREVKDYLLDPARFEALGATLPRGILLYGPSGSGKTLLAKALAGEGGVPFYFVSAASFVEVYVGVGAQRVRQLFEEAKKNAPSIVFIDELDAVGRRRNSEAPGEREYDHTLNQLLIELDGFASASGVVLIGATNRPEMIDPALLRPGRFDRRIHVAGPDVVGRERILRLHASKRPHSRAIDWRAVATRTGGLTGAELANIINEASFLAARKHRTEIGAEDVEEALERAISGPRSGRVMDEEERRLIAYHEAGHALLSLLLRGVRPVSRISIVGRIGDGGKSIWSSGEDREVMTRRELMAKLMVLLAGMAAEIHTFGEPSTRAEDDLREAFKLARQMVERWAMTGKYEFSASDNGRDPYSRMDASSNQEVRKLLKRAEQAAVTIIQDNDRRLRAVAQALMERESLNIDEVARLAGLDGLEAGDDDYQYGGSSGRPAPPPVSSFDRELSRYGGGRGA
ncbi:MAG TPA: AAA family ATPase [Actinomycetota bacterium]|nr:AAA family ATPase [Actinomycetota bacterium]